MNFKDHFSGHSRDYAAFRPDYPDALFQWLKNQVAEQASVWEAGCGTGQATRQLAGVFQSVTATDASAQQIAAATAPANAHFRVAAAEASGLPVDSVDLICVAQAMHWFDAPEFFAEVTRVCRPGGLLVVWTYGSVAVAGIPAGILSRFEHETIGRYWPTERQHIDDGYAHFRLPGREIEVPAFEMSVTWPMDRLLGYVASWSALRRCRVATGADPLPQLREELAAHWGDPAANRALEWPLVVRATRL